MHIINSFYVIYKGSKILMKLKKINLVLVLILGLMISTYFSVKLTNIFITPIGLFIANIKNTNSNSNIHLLKHGINIKLKKYEWYYNVKNMNDITIVNFTGDILSKNPSVYQMADMHILDQNISAEQFLELTKVNIGKCDEIVQRVEQKKNYLSNYTQCRYNGKSLIHYDIPKKKIMITFYPYEDTQKQVFQNFIKGIEVK